MENSLQNIIFLFVTMNNNIMNNSSSILHSVVQYFLKFFNVNINKEISLTSIFLLLPSLFPEHFQDRVVKKSFGLTVV